MNTRLTPEELRIIAFLTVKLTELRQAECKHLSIEHFSVDLFGNFIREYQSASRAHALGEKEKVTRS